MYSFFRFAVQLLAPSAIAAKIAGRNNITVEDIKDIGELFLDAKSSAVMLEANADKYMKWNFQKNIEICDFFP